MTVGAAVIFMLTSLSLAVLSKERSVFSLTDTGAQEGTEAPVETAPASEEQPPAEAEHQNMAPEEGATESPEKPKK
jgi:hypothetical protein